MTRFAPAVLAAGLAVAAASAADPPPPQARMLTPGKSLLTDDLTGPLSADWKAAKGDWKAADGALRGAELKDDKHAAVVGRPVAFRDAIVEVAFKFDGAKAASLSLNAAKGHVCRVNLRPTGFSVQKDDQDGKNGPDKGAQLGSCDAPFKPGERHTLGLELRGPEMLATVDGKHTAYGTHAAVDMDKASVRLTVSGESVQFKNVRVWEGKPNPDWEKRKADVVEKKVGG